MFEKEAEEYATKECCTTCKALNCKEKCECWTFAKKGAEFGYNKSMNEAKGIIKDLLHCLPKENIEGVYEVAEEAEQFLKELENELSKM